MDPMTATYLRSILYNDGEDQRPFPPSLIELHKWTQKRHQALGCGPSISKTVALCMVMTWLSTTEDGRQFAQEETPLGDMFTEPAGEASEAAEADGNVRWEVVPQNAKVTISDKGKTLEGLFQQARGNWIDVVVDGNLKHFRANKVQLVGA